MLPLAFSRDKVLTREVCVEAGIPSPRYARIKTEGDIEPAAKQVGFPAVLKPASGADSISVFRVDDEAQLRQRYTQILDGIASHLKTSGVHSDDMQEQLWATGVELTLEEYLHGEEFDVDCLLSENEMVYAGVVYNMPQTFCKEVGSQVPPPFPDEKQAELVSFTHRCVDALGFANGAFHVELKYTSAGPRLIEINARIGGGFNYQMNRMVWGVDLVEQYLMTCLGLPIRPHKPATPLICVAESDMPCSHSGVIARDDFLDGIASDPRVLLCKTKVHTGQRVTGPEDGVPDWLGEVLVSGHSVDAAKQTLDELLEQVESPIQRYS